MLLMLTSDVNRQMSRYFKKIMFIKQNIVIIGAGEIGTAIKTILLKKGIKINIWDKNQAKLKEKISLSQIIPKAKIIFLCVPSWANREVLKNIKDYLLFKPKKIIITLSKGFEKRDCKTMKQVLEEELANRAYYGILAGPMLASEIKKGCSTKGIFALSNQKCASFLIQLFYQTNLDITFSKDLSGVSAVSALKNIYALAFGMVDELKLGNNIKGYLLIQVLEEMQKITLFFGGKQKTIQGLAGIGDLFTTITSRVSYNYSLGRQIVISNQNIKKSEGVVSLGAICKLLDNQTKNFKILYLLKRIVLEQADPQQEFEKL